MMFINILYLLDYSFKNTLITYIYMHISRKIGKVIPKYVDGNYGTDNFNIFLLYVLS